MATATEERPEEIIVPLIYGGVSEQPAHARFLYQVESATNATFSVTDGFSKRPGTVFVCDLTALLTGSKYRAHPLDRDEGEHYAVVYGVNTLATMHFVIRELGGNNQFATVTVSAAAQNYLDAFGPEQADDLRLTTVADYTLITNIRVPTALTETATYSVDRSWRDYDVLISFTTGQGQYFHTETATGTQEPGYWQYDVGSITFAHINLTTFNNAGAAKFMDLGEDGFWRATTTNPKGFKIAFGRFGPFTLAGASFAGSTVTLGSALLTNYVFREGDHYYNGNILSASLAIGWYKISSKTATTIVLASTTPTSTTTYKDVSATVTDGFIGNQFEVVMDGRDIVFRDMQDVALEIQRLLRAAGAEGACCVYYGRGDYGAFQITSPYRGSNATIYCCVAPNDPGAPPGNVYDMAAAAHPFDTTAGTYQIFSGTGSISNQTDTLPPESRWTRVPAPNQEDGALFSATSAFGTAFGMPVQLVRQSPSGTGTITSVSVAADGVVTTGGAHGLVVGQTAVIAGTTVTPGTLNGSKTVTAVPTDTTFRCGVDTSGGVADGTGTFTARPYFTIDVADWSERISGDKFTNPAPKPFQEGRPVREISFHRNRLVLAMGETLVFSAANDLFNFFKENANNIVDSDPIVAPLGSRRVTIIDRLSDYRDTMVIFTLAGRQFDFGTPEALTPSTASADPSTSYQTKDVRPATLGNRLYFIGARGCDSQVLEYFYDDLSLSSDGNDISQHVRTLMPDDIHAIVGHENTSALYILPDDGDSLVVHQSYWAGPRQRQQSAWTTFAFNDDYTIFDEMILAERMYLLTKTASLWFLERMPLVDEDLACHYEDITDPAPTITEPWTTHLDRRFYKAAGSGTYDGTDDRTTYDLGVAMPGNTLDTAVILSTGEERPVVLSAGTTVAVQGDTSAVNVVIGCAFEMSVQLSRPFARNGRGEPLLRPRFVCERMVVSHQNAGSYTVRTVRGTTVTTKPYTTGSFGVSDGEQSFAEVHGDMSAINVFIESAGARPVTICGVHYTGHTREGLD